MLIRRCAWHRKYRGYPLIFGIGDWRGRGIVFTDGMCRSCAARLRWEWNLTAVSQDARAQRERPRLPLAVPPGAVALIALAVTLFVARPLDRGTSIIAPPLGAAVAPSLLPSASPRLPAFGPAARADALDEARSGAPAARPSTRRAPRAVARVARHAARPHPTAPAQVARALPEAVPARPPRPAVVSGLRLSDAEPGPLFPASATRAMLTLYRDPASPLAALQTQAP